MAVVWQSSFLHRQCVTSPSPADHAAPFMPQHHVLVGCLPLRYPHAHTPNVPAPTNSQHLCHLLGLFSFMLLPSAVV